MTLQRLSQIILIATAFSATAALAEIRNLGQVNPLVFRGARLTEEADYQALSQKLDVKAVINLEKFRNDNDHWCGKYGMHCVEFPIFLPPVPNSDRWFDFKMLQSAFRAVVMLSEQRGERVFFHCYHGSDRTGTLAAALQIRAHACAGDYDHDALRTLVSDSLRKHGFHARLYPRLLRTISSWIDSPPAWICDQNR